MEPHPGWNCSRNYGQLSKAWTKGKAVMKGLNFGNSFGKPKSPLLMSAGGPPKTPPVAEKKATIVKEDEPVDESKRVLVKFALDFQVDLPPHIPDRTHKPASLRFETPQEVHTVTYLNLEKEVLSGFGHHFESLRAGEHKDLIRENDHWEAFKTDWLQGIDSRRHVRAKEFLEKARTDLAAGDITQQTEGTTQALCMFYLFLCIKQYLVGMLASVVGANASLSFFSVFASTLAATRASLLGLLIGDQPLRPSFMPSRSALTRTSSFSPAIKSIQFIASDPALQDLIDADCIEDLVQSIVSPLAIQLEVLTTLLIVVSFNAKLLLQCDVIPEIVEFEPAMHKEALLKTLHLFWNLYVANVDKVTLALKDSPALHFFVKCFSSSELVGDSIQLICHTIDDQFESVVSLGEPTIQSMFTDFLLQRQPKVCVRQDSPHL
jgi:hypothetical protein